MPKAKTPRATTPPNKQVLTMPEATPMAQVRKASSSTNPQTRLRVVPGAGMHSRPRERRLVPGRSGGSGPSEPQAERLIQEYHRVALRFRIGKHRVFWGIQLPLWAVSEKI